MKYILRIIGLPFFIILSFIATIRLWLVYIYNYCRYGSEWIVYTKEKNPRSINEAVEKLLNERDTEI